jgi:hypothetical protein
MNLATEGHESCSMKYNVSLPGGIFLHSEGQLHTRVDVLIWSPGKF